MFDEFDGVNVGDEDKTDFKGRVNVTGDILSFKRCPRQYGLLTVKGFTPSHTTQQYFGQLIHQVLDLAHLHYQGWLDDEQRGESRKVPTDEEIRFYFDQVERALVAVGIKPSGVRRPKALELIQKFNKLEGPVLYPRVKETEYELTSDIGTHIMTRTVDVLIVSGTQDYDNPQIEIWDYKGSRFPGYKSKTFWEHRLQMHVYANLYKMRAGRFPDKTVLYYVNELDSWSEGEDRPLNAYIEVPVDKALINKAVEDFASTAEKIDYCKTINKWDPPNIRYRDTKTCDDCDIRWGCPEHGDKYRPRYP